MNSAMPPLKWNSADARRIFALVGQRDLQALVQERQLAQPLRERVEVELGRVHDGRVGLEGDLGAGLLAGLAGLVPAAPWECPCAYSCSQVQPSRQISSCSASDSAFTQLTPTPCRPPETL